MAGGGRRAAGRAGWRLPLLADRDRRTHWRTPIRRPSRSIVAVTAAVLVVGGAGGAWAWSEREERVAAEQAATQEREADALEAQVHDVEALQILAADAAVAHVATVR